MTDPIADMLTRIRNAVTAKQTRVDMPSSRIKSDIAQILQGRPLKVMHSAPDWRFRFAFYYLAFNNY